MLFNLAMASLLWRLAIVPDLVFTIYTDDITARNMGSDNAPPPETTVQRARDVVTDFLKEAPVAREDQVHDFWQGLEEGRRDLHFDGQEIDEVLAVNVHSGGDPTGWIERMRTTRKKGL